MIWNLALLLLAFGSAKKGQSPYLAALLLGAIKFVAYLVTTGSIFIALVMAAIFAGLGAAFVYFIERLARPSDTEKQPSSLYQLKATDRFRWEYVPLFAIIPLIVGGELILTLLYSPGVRY